MSGHGQPSGTFDVTNLTITEVGGLAPSEIINSGNSVTFTTEFGFTGVWANWLVSLPLAYEVRVVAESIGPGGEFTFPVATGNTVTGQLNYSVPITGPVTLPAGVSSRVYKLTALVTFPGAPPAPIAGYYEGPIIQVIP